MDTNTKILATELQSVLVENSIDEPKVNSVPVSKIAAMVSEASDSFFLDNLQLFYDSLNLPSSEYSRIRLQYTLGMENCYGLVARIIEDWVNNVGSFATVGNLFQILLSIECVALQESLQKTLKPDTKIVIGPNPSRHTGNGGKIPNKLPINFQVFRSNKNFVGRTLESQNLFCQYKAFRDSTDGVGIILVTGPEGVGKSSLVNQFCGTVRDTFAHSCIWLQADSPSSTAETLHQLALEMEIETDNGDPLDKISTIPSKIIRSVHEKHGRIPLVLVLDNLRQDNEVVKRLLISLNELSFPRVFVIITLTHGPLVGFMYNEIHLEGLNKSEVDEYITGLKNQETTHATDLSIMAYNILCRPLFLTLIRHYVKLQQNSGTYTITKFLTETNLNTTDENSILPNNTMKVLSQIIAPIFAVLDGDVDLQKSVFLILRICTIIFPVTRIQLNCLQDVYNNFNEKSSDRFLEAMLFLQSLEIVQVGSNVLLQEIYSAETMYETRFVGIHPMLVSAIQPTLKEVPTKKELVINFTKQFGKLSNETQGFFVRIKADLTQNLLEFKGESVYADIKKTLLIAENPKELFVPWVQKITIAGSYCFFFCITVLLGVALEITWGVPSTGGIGLRIVFYLCLAVYLVVCVVVTYLGIQILQDSTKIIKKYFMGSAAKKQFLLIKISAVLGTGFIVLLALVIKIGGYLMFSVVAGSSVYISIILIWIINSATVRAVTKSRRQVKSSKKLN